MIIIAAAVCFLGQSFALTTDQVTKTTNSLVSAARTWEPEPSQQPSHSNEPLLIGKVNPLIWAAILLLGSLTALFAFTRDGELDEFFANGFNSLDQTATREPGTGNSLPNSTT